MVLHWTVVSPNFVFFVFWVFSCTVCVFWFALFFTVLCAFPYGFASMFNKSHRFPMRFLYVCMHDHRETTPGEVPLLLFFCFSRTKVPYQRQPLPFLLFGFVGFWKSEEHFWGISGKQFGSWGGVSLGTWGASLGNLGSLLSWWAVLARVCTALLLQSSYEH